jgi:hypothetical protein
MIKSGRQTRISENNSEKTTDIHEDLSLDQADVNEEL